MAYEQHVIAPLVYDASDYGLLYAALWFIFLFAVFVLLFDAFEHDADHWDD